MNKKQLVTVWVGAALMIFFIFWQLYVYCWRVSEINGRCIGPKEVWKTLFATGELPVIVAVLAVALTCTFADKKPKEEQKQ